jgi:hypothetical protein
MSNDTERSRPNVLQYIAYSYGRVLPDSMQDWVRNDLAGKGATARTNDPGHHSGLPGIGPVLADPDNAVCAREYDAADFPTFYHLRSRT